MILGNKCDKDEIRVIPTSHGEELAENLNIPFYETSAKDNINIDNAIISMTKRIISEKVNFGFLSNLAYTKGFFQLFFLI